MKIKFVNKTPNEICMFLNELLDGYDLDLHIANVYLTFEKDQINYDLYEEYPDGSMNPAEIIVNRRSLDLDNNNACGLKKLTKSGLGKVEKEIQIKKEKNEKPFIPPLMDINKGYINREEFERKLKEERQKCDEEIDF